MSAIPTDDTLSRDRLPRGMLSQVMRAPPTLPGAELSGPEGHERGDGARQGLAAQLRTLAGLRAVVGTGLLVALVVLGTWLNASVPEAPLLAGLGALLLVNAWLWQRLRQRRAVTEAEYFGHLLFDVVWLAYTLYWTGGATHNPFADLFILYVGMAAVVLRVRHIAAISALSLLLYGALRLFHHDIDFAQAGLDPDSLDAVAHAVHFVAFAAIVAVFGFRLADTTRRYLALSAQARERECRTESAVSMAALAAGTAHEMGTPLTTVAVLVSDLRRDDLTPAEREASLERIADAVKACKSSLNEMASAIGADRLAESTPVPARRLVERLVEKFRPMRPGVPVVVALECAETCLIDSSAPLRQALLNLITNAADASPDGIEVRLRCDPVEVQIDVLDRGPGISDDVLSKLGHSIVTTKSALRGSGVGVFLSNMTITRLGGCLHYLKRDGGGTCARVVLPTTRG